MKKVDFTMKRRVDELGRIVLPKDIRYFYGINSGDALEIIATEDGILLRIPCKPEESPVSEQKE